MSRSGSSVVILAFGRDVKRYEDVLRSQKFTDTYDLPEDDEKGQEAGGGNRDVHDTKTRLLLPDVPCGDDEVSHPADVGEDKRNCS